MSSADEPVRHATSLLELVDLREVGEDSFLAPTSWSFGPRLFGGLVAAQSMAAACRTVGVEHVPHSLHAYFILPGDPTLPLRLEVERTRDGRSFTTRRVLASQGDAAIFEMSASFHRGEDGVDWSTPPPVDAPDPETLVSWAGPDGSPSIGNFEVRPLKTPDGPYTPPPYWVRSIEPVPDDPPLQASLLTYLSDMGILAMAIPPDPGPIGSATSLDHAVWFHRPFHPEQWHLFAGLSRSARGGRALAVGGLYHRDGSLVATVVQEGLLRRPRPSTRSADPNGRNPIASNRRRGSRHVPYGTAELWEATSAMTEHQSMNTVIHAAFRRDLQRFDGALDSFPDGSQVRADQLSAAWNHLSFELHLHHHEEQTLFWPALLDLGVDPSLIDDLGGEHERMIEALSKAEDAMDALGSDPTKERATEARQAIAELHRVLDEHLVHEERDLEPFNASHQDTKELKAAKAGARKSHTEGSGTFFAWLGDGSDPDVARAIRHEVPAPVLFVMTRVGGRKYNRLSASTWN